MLTLTVTYTKRNDYYTVAYTGITGNGHRNFDCTVEVDAFLRGFAKAAWLVSPLVRVKVIDRTPGKMFAEII